MMFGYATPATRERRRAALYDDPAFAAYLKKAREFIVAQEVRLLKPAPCNPRIEGVNLSAR
jgi:hypothetical protein